MSFEPRLPEGKYGSYGQYDTNTGLHVLARSHCSCASRIAHGHSGLTHRHPNQEPVHDSSFALHARLASKAWDGLYGSDEID